MAGARRLASAMAGVVMLLAAAVAPLRAAPAVDTHADATLEARVQALAAELRCLVCQNQSLADSHADLALDLKKHVREQLRAGRSEAEVLAFMTERYGDFVRYRPPLKGTTALLWAGPALMVLMGAVLGWRSLRRGQPGAAERGLTDDETERAAAWLDAGAPQGATSPVPPARSVAAAPAHSPAPSARA